MPAWQTVCESPTERRGVTGFVGDELVSFYAQPLQGSFFRNPQTLQEFRRILSLGDIACMVPFPLGFSIFGKAGYYDSPGPHARCIAGGM
ncbi:MAG TPA: hypothetical protein VGD78_20310 [Chthoniobacterales bacterium]